MAVAGYSASVVLASLLTGSLAAHAENPYDPIETLLIQQECITLGHRYSQFVDSGTPQRVVELFDEHGKLEGVNGSYAGREAIGLAFGQRPSDRTSFHLTGNHVATVHSRNLVTVDSYYVYYRHDGKKKGGYAPIEQPFAMGRYYDECVRTESGRWLLQLRQIQRTFSSAAN